MDVLLMSHLESYDFYTPDGHVRLSCSPASVQVWHEGERVICLRWSEVLIGFAAFQSAVAMRTKRKLEDAITKVSPDEATSA
jgi:hypothetical protein